uniref:Uncharacterized protein n=1 Tax=uncultured marine virus TaxID=186617 RepID=A0A0F7L778_9VIRU|nr:hypothetical protein [uncultured marine virus]
MTRCTCGRFSPPTMRPRLELVGLTMTTTVRCDDCDPSPLARQLRTHAALRASAALDKRLADIARHHDRESVRAWTGRHAEDFVDDFGGLHCRTCGTVYKSEACPVCAEAREAGARRLEREQSAPLVASPDYIGWPE